MPRIARKDNQSFYFHVMVQGIAKEKIFQKEEFKRKYLKLIKNIFDEYKGLELLVYCMMDNHAHLLIYTKDNTNLSKAMGRTNSRYALYYNKVNNRVGYVFRNRYNSKPIMDREQLFHTISYIHKNPVKAGIVSKMEDYSNSSYSFYKKRKMRKEIVSLLFHTSDYMEIFDFIHKNYGDYEMSIFEKKKREEAVNYLVQTFCNKQGVSLNEIKKDNDLLLLLLNEIKKKIIITDKEVSLLLGIGKNRIRNIKKRD